MAFHFIDRTKKNRMAFEYMNQLRKHKQRCDVILIADNVEIGAHKIVLASSSLYFHVKFFLEKVEHCLVLEGINARILQRLVDYIYTSELTITQADVRELLVTSNTLVLKDVWKQCCSFIRRNLSPANCLGIVDWARGHDYAELMIAAQEYIGLHYGKVIKSDEFLTRSYQTVQELISAQGKRVKDDKLLETILVWTNYDIANRRAHFKDLLECIDISSVPPEYLFEKLDEPLLKENVLYLTKAMNVLKHHFMRSNEVKGSTANADVILKFSDQGNTVQTADINLSGGFKIGMNNVLSKESMRPAKMDTLVVAGYSDGILRVERYDFVELQWFEVAVTTKNLTPHCSIIFYKKQIYIIDLVRDTIEIYNPGSKKWTSASSLVPIHNASYCCHGAIFAVGLCNDTFAQKSNNVWMCDASTNIWSPIPAPMTQPRGGSGLVVMKGKIYAVGGHNGSVLKSAECYDLNLKRWTSIPAMICRRHKPGVGVLDGVLYVVGGFNVGPLNSFEAYDLKTKTWTLLPSMHIKRGIPGVIVHNNCVFVIGGVDTQPLKSCEMYDIQKGTWTLLPDMKSPKEDMATLIIDSRKDLFYQ